jgi:hypothetical protein
MILLRHRGAKDDQDAIASDSPAQAPILLGRVARQLL